MFTQVFGTPRGHPRSKPFFDRVMSFAIVDGRVWVRNYQILEVAAGPKGRQTETTLSEIGPRFTLNPIRIFDGRYKQPCFLFLLYSDFFIFL